MHKGRVLPADQVRRKLLLG